MRTMIALSALAIASSMVGAACGTAESGSSSPASSSVSVPPEIGGPAVEEMSALQRPAASRDRLPSELGNIVSLVRDGSQASAHIGELSLEDSRVLMQDVGSREADFFVVPTDSGTVCFTGLGAGCVADFSKHPGGVHIGFGDLGGMRVVRGLIPDDVVNIAVVIDGSAKPAFAQNNAYFYEIEGTGWPEALVVTYRNGSEQTVAIATPERP